VALGGVAQLVRSRLFVSSPADQELDRFRNGFVPGRPSATPGRYRSPSRRTVPSMQPCGARGRPFLEAADLPVGRTVVGAGFSDRS
jgi:hypothetical protein